MTIKPLADRVLVLPAQAEEKVGGIMILKVGDEVLYGKYAGTELENEGEKYLMMRQSDVLAIVE